MQNIYCTDCDKYIKIKKSHFPKISYIPNKELVLFVFCGAVVIKMKYLKK